MEKCIRKNYFDKMKLSWRIAFVSAVIVGLVIHMYKFTNNLPNHDSLYNYYGDQNMIASGRWFLSIVCGISSFFDLPWLIGWISLIMLGITSVLVVEIFCLNNPLMIILCSSLLVSFPALTDTLMYEFTADGYMIAMLLATLSVYLFRVEHTNSWKRACASAVCICLSCAIYQAYLSFALVLAICYLMLALLDDSNDGKAYAKWILVEAMIYISALAAYYAIWKILLRLQMRSAGAYLGIDQLGQISIHTIITAVKQSLYSLVMFLFDRNIFEHGLTTYSLINLMIAAVGFTGFVCAVKNSRINKRKGQLLLLLLCIATLPFVCSIWLFASPGVTYTPRMYQSVAVIYIFIGAIFEKWVSSKRSIMVFLLAVYVFNNALIANISYTFMEQAYQKTYATAIEMNTRMHLVDDGTAENVVFVGLKQYWDEEDLLAPGGAASLGPLRDSVKYSYITGGHLIIPFLTQYTDFNLAFYVMNDMEMPNYEPLENTPISQNWNIQFPTLDQDRVTELELSDEVQQMGMWPAADSVRQIGNTIIIKLSEGS